MSNKVITYRCGSGVRKQRESAQMSPLELGQQVFPFSTKKSQAVIIYQIEGDKRGVSIKTAWEIDHATGNGKLVEMIQNGEFDVFKK